MSQRSTQLAHAAEGQIVTLIGLLAGRGEEVLGTACPGREKLGDGTVGALAQHVAGNYGRIAGFTAASDSGAGSHGPRDHGPGRPGHFSALSADLQSLLSQLAEARAALSVIGELSDEQLDAVPAASEMRFVDGQRTVAQILAAMLKHQDHQIDAIRAALG